jgi:4-hydroxybenzoate polyprenyltransferase
VKESAATNDPSVSQSKTMQWRWWIYQRERFPIVAHGPLIAAFSFCAVSLSTHLRGEQRLSPASLAVAFVTCLLFFFQLRIADEFKDFDEDSRYRPYRPVPRGLVSLRELGFLFVGSAMIQLVLAVWLAPRLVILLAIAWVYLGLMSREFGMREFLKARPLAYLVSHMMIMPLVDLYATGTDWMVAGEGMPKSMSWFLVASFFNGMSLDLGRKIRSPADEEIGVPTYSVLWGARVAVTTWWFFLAASMVCAIAVAASLNMIWHMVILYSLLLMACTIVGIRFVRSPHPGRGRLIETMTFLWTLGLYLGLGLMPWLIGGSK